MRRISPAALRQLSARPKTVAKTVAAPIGGLNTRDSVDAMPEEDAVKFDNWFPTTGSCQIRMGYAEHATGIGSVDVFSLFEFHSGATKKLISCGGGSIYDATSAGAASSLGSGFSQNKWQGVSFNGYLHLVNGTDVGQNYEGTTLAAMTWTGSGLTQADLIGVMAHRSRLYFWEKDTQDFWYGGVNSISGTLTKFPLSRVAQFGGNLLSIGSWTVDGGDGVNDYAAFMMTSGEVIIYQGSDPGDATDWSLIGKFKIGEPIHVRASAQLAGDLIITTSTDYVYMSQVLQSGQVGVSSKLSGALGDSVINRALDGWQSIVWQKGNMILFNVPTVNSNFDQHVINTVTGAACRFKDIPARCWAVYDTDLYFGAGDGKVYKMTGNTDDGAEISADGVQAWSKFGTPQTKVCAAIRPVLRTEGSINYEIAVGGDFQEPLSPPSTSTTGAGSPWDTSEWDIADWSAESVIDVDWKISDGIGQSLAPRLRVASKQKVEWLRTDYRLEVGINL